jgi:N-acetylglutamate synthase-like GNAT family acetyltransferase
MQNKSNKNHMNFQIVEYKPEYKTKYKDLNYEWLKKNFKIESSDEKILSDPENEIIDKNGFIFFALFKDEVIGTCTLIRHDDETYELSKLSVTEKYKRKGAGEKLIDTAILKARRLGIKKIFLYTNKKLTAALNLYNKKGFKIISNPEKLTSNYERESIYMDYDLDNDCKEK